LVNTGFVFPSRGSERVGNGVHGEGRPTKLPAVNNPPTQVRIVADDREIAGGVIASLRGMNDVKLEVKRLARIDHTPGSPEAISSKGRAEERGNGGRSGRTAIFRWFAAARDLG
jgi:hypothetical protein